MVIAVAVCIVVIGIGGLFVACNMNTIGMGMVYTGACTVVLISVATLVYVVAETVKIERRICEIRKH